MVKPTDRLRRYGDGNGLYLLVKPGPRGGGKSWVQRLAINGTRRDLGLGSAELITLPARALEVLRAARIDAVPHRSRYRIRRRGRRRLVNTNSCAENGSIVKVSCTNVASLVICFLKSTGSTNCVIFVTYYGLVLTCTRHMKCCRRCRFPRKKRHTMRQTLASVTFQS